MARLVLFHSALGKTPGIEALADEFRRHGHAVIAPDYYDGMTFTTSEAGVGYSRTVGFSSLVDRARAVCDDLPGPLIFAGLSLGASIAQQMAKNDGRARGALLFHGGGFPSRSRWQSNVPVQVHFSVHDAWRESGAAEFLMESAAAVGAGAESYLYPGDSHLFSDPMSEDFRPESAALLLKRSLCFLESTRALDSLEAEPPTG